MEVRKRIRIGRVLFIVCVIPRSALESRAKDNVVIGDRSLPYTLRGPMTTLPGLLLDFGSAGRLDVWRKKCARREGVVLRYADDIVLGFQWGTDADRGRTGTGLMLSGG